MTSEMHTHKIVSFHAGHNESERIVTLTPKVHYLPRSSLPRKYCRRRLSLPLRHRPSKGMLARCSVVRLKRLYGNTLSGCFTWGSRQFRQHLLMFTPLSRLEREPSKLKVLGSSPSWTITNDNDE